MVTKELSSLLFLTSFLSASCRPTRFVPFTVDEDEKVTFPDDRKKSLLTPPEAVKLSVIKLCLRRLTLLSLSAVAANF